MWTSKNRRRYDRSQLRYPSDLTDDEWGYVAPLIPPAKRGGNKRSIDEREVMNGIMYILSTGCQWRAIPKDLPARSTLFDYLDLWSYDGTLDRIHRALYVEYREQGEREASPTAAIIDSQSVKSAEKGGPASIRMVMMRARRSKARNAPYSRRHAGIAAARDRPFRRHPGSRRRHPAACNPVRNASPVAEAVCGRWLSRPEIPESPRQNPAQPRSRYRQAFRSCQRLCSAAQALDRRAHNCLAQSLQAARQGLGEPQSQRPRVLAPCLNPPHAPKTLQSSLMFPDRL
jgi:transposase